jgi:hypothetical protein
MRTTCLLSFSALALAISFGGCSDERVRPTSDTGLGEDAARGDGGLADAGRDTGPAIDTGMVPADTGMVTVDTGVADPDAFVETDAAVDVDAFVENDAFVGTDAFVARDGGTDAGNRSPTCTITAPPDGTVRDFDAAFTFVASASDPEDGPLSGASVVWRSNLVVAPLGSGLSLTRTLPPGAHTIRCIATDSVGNTGSSTIMVTSRSPVAAIFHPGDGEVRVAGSSIPFVGQGRDFEDGMLTGGSLVWRSSIDGMIGTGTSFNRALSAGTNVITLTVTDSMGNTGTSTITLTITP